jgi:hypothetical protein
MQSDYAAAWRDYRKRAIIFWVIFLSYLPGVGVIFLMIGPSLAAWTGIKLDNVGLMIALCWMIAFAIAGFRLSLFRCPRCGNSFSWGSWHTNIFARKCLHCGLPKWAESDEPISN